MFINKYCAGAALLLVSIVSYVHVHAEDLLAHVQSELVSQNAPKVSWPFFVDAAGPYLAVITEDGGLCKVYDSTGIEIKQLRPRHGIKFFEVLFCPSGDVLLLGERLGEDIFAYMAITLQGELLFEGLELGGGLRPTETGKYFYTVNNDPVFTAGPPCVFDASGQLLAKLDARGPMWDIKAAGDSLIIFHNADEIHLLDLPDLTIKRSYSLDALLPPIILRTSISSDGTAYVFATGEHVAVCNLETGEIHTVDTWRAGDITLNPSFVVSDGGTWLVLYDSSPQGQLVSYYRLVGDAYRAIVDRAVLPLTRPVETPIKNAFICDSTLLLNYFSGSRQSGLLLTSYALRPQSQQGSTVAGLELNGYAMFADGNCDVINLLVTDDSAGGKISRLTLSLTESD